MPLVIEPIKELRQVEIQPSIEKVEYSQVNAIELGFLIALIVVLYLIRKPLLAFFAFLLKLGALSFLAYCSYILFIQ
jgi:hypothetical protein